MTNAQSTPITKPIKHRLQFFAYLLLVGIFKIVPKSRRPHVVGSLLGFVGPKTGINKRVLRNLSIGLPNLTNEERLKVSQGVWYNLGTVYAEMTVGAKLAHPADGIVEEGNLQDYKKLTEGGRGAIMIGAHFGNWELSVLHAGHVLNEFTGFYRQQNNALINDKINEQRTSTGATLIAKNDRKGLRKAVESLKNGGTVGVLMDQKLKGAEQIPFLGVPAQTMPIAFSLAQSTGAVVIPYRLKRQPDGSYINIFDDQIVAPNTGDKHADRRAFLEEINDVISRWVVEDPDQWFWFHNRWD